MKFKYIVLVVSLASLALLYLLTGLSQPPTIALTDAPHHEGQHVVVTGRIQHYQPTSNNAQLITLSDPDTGGTLTLYTTQPTTIDYGDLIQADGTIEQYQGTWELAIDTANAITILQHDNTTLYPLWQLALDPHKYQDTTITTTGLVDSTTRTSFTLKDPNGTATIPVYGATTQPTKGTQIVIHARFLFDPDTFRYTLHLTNTTVIIQKR